MKVFLYVFIVLLQFSCSNRESTELLKLKPIEELQAVIPISEFADSIYFVQLDNRFILASYGNVCLTDSFFVVYAADGVLKYSYKGELLKEIGEIGQAPTEYNRYSLMAVDELNKRICVYSVPEKVMVNYSYDGDFLNRVHFDMPDDTYGSPVKMHVLFNKHFFFYTSMSGVAEPYYWAITDTCGQRLEIKQLHGCPVLKRGYACGTLCSSSMDNSLLYYNLFNDTVFRFTENGVETAFLWEQGKHRIPISLSAEEITENQTVFTMLGETQRFIFFKWNDAALKSFSTFGFYDKKKKTFMGSKKLIDDLDTKISIPLLWEFSYANRNNKDYMIGKIDPYNLPEAILRREKIDPDGNPVLILMQLKDE